MSKHSMKLFYYTAQDAINGSNPVRVETARTLKAYREAIRLQYAEMDVTRRNKAAKVKTMVNLSRRGIKWEA